MGCVRISCRQIDVPSERERLTLWWGCWVLNKGSSEGVVSLSSSCPSATGLEGSSCGSPGSRSAESVDTGHSVWASQCAIFPESGGANAMEDTSSVFSSSQNQRQWTGACSGRGGAPAKAGLGFSPLFRGPPLWVFLPLGRSCGEGRSLVLLHLSFSLFPFKELIKMQKEIEQGLFGDLFLLSSCLHLSMFEANPSTVILTGFKLNSLKIEMFSVKTGQRATVLERIQSASQWVGIQTPYRAWDGRTHSSWLRCGGPWDHVDRSWDCTDISRGH